MEKIPVEVILVSVRRGVAVPERREGQEWFSCRDVAKMKIIHALVLQTRLRTAVEVLYQDIGVDYRPVTHNLVLPNNSLGDCVRELIETAIP